jgi:hypothetical protein
MWSLKFNRYSSQEGAAKWRHGTVLQLRIHLNRLWGDLVSGHTVHCIAHSPSVPGCEPPGLARHLS